MTLIEIGRLSAKVNDDTFRLYDYSGEHIVLRFSEMNNLIDIIEQVKASDECQRHARIMRGEQ